MALSVTDRELVKALQDGLPLEPRPYLSVARSLDLDEDTVMERITQFQHDALIKRMGVIVRHHELGYRCNAMVVWDVPDDRVDQVGTWLGSQEGINLCYRRPRRPPHWPYNLFCMIHARDRDRVRRAVQLLRRHPVLEMVPYTILFSTRRFKQRGARYGFPDTPASTGTGAP